MSVRDLNFVSANLHKIPDGGWFPLMVGATASNRHCWDIGSAGYALDHRASFRPA